MKLLLIYGILSFEAIFNDSYLIDESSILSMDERQSI